MTTVFIVDIELNLLYIPTSDACIGEVSETFLVNGGSTTATSCSYADTPVGSLGKPSSVPTGPPPTVVSALGIASHPLPTCCPKPGMAC